MNDDYAEGPLTSEHCEALWAINLKEAERDIRVRRPLMDLSANGEDLRDILSDWLSYVERDQAVDVLEELAGWLMNQGCTR